MQKETLRGYLLEEALAYLIRTSGYKLLVDPRQDSYNLQNGQAGIEVRGRGGWHQADVLGQLEIIPAFSYPFRLFMEAKHRGDKVDMPIIRSAVGIVSDVNQAPLPVVDPTNLPYAPAYHYVYSVFSASGFDANAIKMATSYLISLVDMSMDEYRDLLESIDNTAQQILTQFTNTNGLVKDVRYSLRLSLNTYPENFSLEQPNNERAHGYYTDLKTTLSSLVRTVKSYDRLYVGTINAPFILVLKSDNPKKFEKYSLKYKNTDHKVEIHWSDSIDDGRTWFISPVAGADDEKYVLSFRLPSILGDWIFKVETDKQRKAMQAKLEYLSSINVYIRGKGMDHVVKLQFDPEATMQNLRT